MLLGKDKCHLGSSAAKLFYWIRVAWLGMQFPKVLVLAGPTGVGKTELSLSLAEKLNGEIISADSVQVYRGLNVGSDKIPLEHRRGIPHHMVDIQDVTEDFSAGLFYDKARELTREIVGRNRTPIVVGGTGLYLKWFTQGKPSTQERSEELRQELDNRLQQAWISAELLKGSPLSDEEKWREGVRLLEDAGDQEAANRIQNETNNYCRLMRALEVVVGMGRVMSDLNINPEQQREYDFRCFFLSRPRLDLFKRIGRRCEQMVGKVDLYCCIPSRVGISARLNVVVVANLKIVDGLLTEAVMMLNMGLDPGQNSATRAIGYRQAMEFLQALLQSGESPTNNSLLQLALDIQSATRTLIRHQTNWFKKDGSYHLVDVSDENLDVSQYIISEFNKDEHQGGFDDYNLTKDELRAIRCYRPTLGTLSDPSVLQHVMDRLHDLIQTSIHANHS